MGPDRTSLRTCPIIVIDTFGSEIPDEPKVHASMGIIYNGPGESNQIGMPFSYHFGNIGIERRGNSTQGFDKLSYSVETWDGNLMDTDVDFFGMGAEEDWILHAMHIDKTQIRFPFTFRLFQQMGHYASEWQFVELVINGEYRGLYLLWRTHQTRRRPVGHCQTPTYRGDRR